MINNLDIDKMFNLDIEKMQEEYEKNILSRVKTEKLTIERVDGTTYETEVEIGPTEEEFNDIMADSPHLRGFINSLLGGDIFGDTNNMESDNE